MKRHMLLAGLALTLLGGSALAQSSTYTAVSVAGDFQGWNPAANNMYLAGDYQWEAVLFIRQPTGVTKRVEFKFPVNGSWNVNWGGSNSPAVIGSAPFTNAANVSSGSNITMTNVTDGFYRFRFNDSTKVFSVELLSRVYDGTNGASGLTMNGNFERADLSNTNEPHAWKWSNKMPYGDRFGNSGWVDWRFRSPQKEMFIATGGGGMWQDAPATEDVDYELSSWFWMDASVDNVWTSTLQEIKLEFFDATKTLLASATTNVPFFTNETMNEVRLLASAPAKTAWARSVVNVSGGGAQGTLQIDDVSLHVRAHPNQYFTSWDFKTTGTVARGGWIAEAASMVTNPALAFVAPSLALRNGGSIQSPYLAEGVSRIGFRYRNSNDGEDGPTNNLPSFQVYMSETGAEGSFQFISGASIADIADQDYKFFTFNAPVPGDFHAFRITVSGGTNMLLVDNLEVLPQLGDQRTQDFSDWTSAAYTNVGCHTLNDWTLCTGRVVVVGTNRYAMLPRSSNTYNSLKSPLFNDGYGQIEVRVARGTNGTAPATMQVQESVDGTTWTTVRTVDSIALTTFSQQTLSLYQPEARYLRFVNASQPAQGGGGGSVLISEEFNAGSTAPPGWTFSSGVGTYTTVPSSGSNPPSIKLDASNKYIETPDLISPTNVYFWMKGQSASGGSKVEVQQWVGGAWSTAQTFTDPSGTAARYSVKLTSTATRVKFLYTKVGGNVALDDVVILGAPQAGQPAQDLLIDDIVIGLPVRTTQTRDQDFEAWPRSNGYGASTFNGWSVTEAMVHPDNAIEGQSARLRQDLNNYVQSPEFQEGIGVIRFDYAKWGTDTSPTLLVQYSTNSGSSWITLDTLTATDTSPAHKTYTRLLNLEKPATVRIFHSAGSGRSFIDNISIGLPQKPVDVLVTALNEPGAPYTNDTVGIRAVVTPLNQALITNVVTYYRIGTNGAFTALPMASSNAFDYLSVTRLGPYNAGTIVQYYTRVDFTGLVYTAGTSPKFYPPGGNTTNPASFGVARSAPGQVWINEVKYEDVLAYEVEFVELAGPTGFNISGWSVDLYRNTTDRPGLGVLEARYVIPSVTLLPPDTPYLGFWVLGQSGIDDRDRLLTNSLDLVDGALGILLRNEVGGIEQALSFGGSMFGFGRVSADDDPFDPYTGVSLAGSGASSEDFVWQEAVPITPGAMNDGQQYEGGGGGSAAPDAWVEQMIWSTNITIITTGNTNQWTVSPWYATEMKSAAVWNPISPFNSSYANGTNTIWFARPAATNYFIRVRFDQP